MSTAVSWLEETNHANGLIEDCTVSPGNIVNLTDRRAIYRALWLNDLLASANSDSAPFITRADEFRRNAARSEAIIISGRPELNTHTPTAARITDRLAAMSFREHSKTELILMSSRRWLQSKKRHAPFAAKPARLKMVMISYEGNTGLASRNIICTTTRLAAMKIKPPLNRATRALVAGPRVTA